MWKRLRKSLLACFLANPLAWATSLVITFTFVALNRPYNENHLNLSIDRIFTSPIALATTAIIFSIFSMPFCVVLGLPLQALLQRIGLKDVVSNTLVAIIIGWPLGIVFLSYLFAEKGEFNTHFILAQLSYGASPEWSSIMIPAYVVSSAAIFWLIRRPDKDVKPLP